MKKWYGKLLVIFGLLMCSAVILVTKPNDAKASQVASGCEWDYDTGNIKWEWELDNKGTLTISGSGELECDEDSEYRCYSDDIISVTISNGITSIGRYAFSDCGNMTTITLPNSVTYIDECAFEYCFNLESVTIPNSVKYIGAGAFRSTAIKSVTIPSGLSNMFGNPFTDCSHLEKIVVDKNNKYYDSRNNCNAIITKLSTLDEMGIGATANTLVVGCKNTTIPSGVKSIGDGAFCGCTGLKSISIPSSVTSIGSGAFRDCDGLTSVTISSNVTSIKSGAFYNCSNLTIYCDNYEQKSYLSGDAKKIVVVNGPKAFFSYSNHVLTIKKNGFLDSGYEDYKNVATKIVINEGVTTIPKYAFDGFSKLQSITIPSTVKSIGIGAFRSCDNLESVYISNLLNWCKISFATFYFDDYSEYETNHAPKVSNPLYHADNLYLNGKKITSIVIPNGVTTLDYYTFCGFKGMTSITLPKSVTSISCDAFEGISATVYCDSSAYIKKMQGNYGGTLSWKVTKNGLVKEGKVWRYYSYNVFQKNYTGPVLYNKICWYVKKGVMTSKYTGLAKVDGTWRYYKKGVFTKINGRIKYGSKYYLVQKGVINFKYTGLAKVDGTWRYYKKGVWQSKYTGFVNLNKNARYRVEKGNINFKRTAILKDGKYYRYYKKGRWQSTFSGKVKISGKTYTIKKGIKK